MVYFFIFIYINICFFLILEEEFNQYYLNERLSYSKYVLPSSLSSKDPLKVSPESFDWRDYNAITDVKNQVRIYYSIGEIFYEIIFFFLGSMWFLLGI